MQLGDLWEALCSSQRAVAVSHLAPSEVPGQGLLLRLRLRLTCNHQLSTTGGVSLLLRLLRCLHGLGLLRLVGGGLLLRLVGGRLGHGRSRGLRCRSGGSRRWRLRYPSEGLVNLGSGQAFALQEGPLAGHVGRCPDLLQKQGAKV